MERNITSEVLWTRPSSVPSEGVLARIGRLRRSQVECWAQNSAAPQNPDTAHLARLGQGARSSDPAMVSTSAMARRTRKSAPHTARGFGLCYLALLASEFRPGLRPARQPRGERLARALTLRDGALKLIDQKGHWAPLRGGPEVKKFEDEAVKHRPGRSSRTRQGLPRPSGALATQDSEKSSPSRTHGTATALQSFDQPKIQRPIHAAKTIKRFIARRWLIYSIT